MTTGGKIFWWIVVALMVGYVIWYYSRNDEEKNDLASCLTKKGVKFYGAHYCGFCKKQKEMFGDAAKNLPYIECADPKNPNPGCKDLTGYPTWVFPNGKILTGAVTMEQLKQYSEC